MINDKLWKVNIPVESGDANRGFSFTGNIEILTDELNVIYDWKITATKIHLDRMVNPDWKSQKNKQFLYRGELFRYAKIEEQFPRPRSWKVTTEQVAQPVILRGTVFDRTLEWLNNSEFFPRSEIMMLPEILGGESRSSTGATKRDELIYTRFHGKQIPITIMLRDHIERHSWSHDELVKIKEDSTIIGEVSFIEWAAMFPQTIGKWANLMVESDLKKDLKKITTKIRKEAKEHFTLAEKTHHDALKEIDKFHAIIKEKCWQRERLMNPIFNVTHLIKNEWNEISEEQETWEQLHIVPIWRIKQLMMESKTPKERNEYLAMISDIANLIPLNYFGANLFERGEVFYDEYGDMKMTVVNHSKAKQLYGYHKIPKSKLTPKVKKYLEMHRDLHDVDPFKKIILGKEKGNK